MLSNTTAIAEVLLSVCFLQEFISSEVCGNFRIATPKLMHFLLSGALLFPGMMPELAQFATRTHAAAW